MAKEHITPQLVSSDIGESHLALRQQGVAGLAEPANTKHAISLVKTWLGKKKASFYYLRLVLDNKNALAYDIASNISKALHDLKEQTQEQLALWQNCSRELKSHILIPDDTVDLELFRQLDLPGEEIMRAFLVKHALPTPKHSAYSTHYTDLDIDSGAILVQNLNGLTKNEVSELVYGTDLRVFYLIAIEEINYFVANDMDDGRNLFVALLYGDQVPPELPFLFWLQVNHAARFKELVVELNTNGWDEIRDQFYQLRGRNTNYGTAVGMDNDTIDSPNSEYLDNLLKDNE